MCQPLPLSLPYLFMMRHMRVRTKTSTARSVTTRSDCTPKTRGLLSARVALALSNRYTLADHQQVRIFRKRAGLNRVCRNLCTVLFTGRKCKGSARRCQRSFVSIRQSVAGSLSPYPSRSRLQDPGSIRAAPTRNALKSSARPTFPGTVPDLRDQQG